VTGLRLETGYVVRENRQFPAGGANSLHGAGLPTDSNDPFSGRKPVETLMSNRSSRDSDLERLRIRDGERRAAHGRRRWPFFLLGAILVIVILTYLMKPSPVEVVTAKMESGGPAEEGGSVLTANGYIEARHQTAVAARTTGRLAEVFVEEGDTVRQGEMVARLIDEDERALLVQAEAALALARARLEQARATETDAVRRAGRRAELRAQNLIGDEEAQAAETIGEAARADRSAAEANVRVAEANLQTAKLALDKTRVTAPFTGVVLRKDAEVGEIVGPIMTSNTARAGAVVTIADMNTLEVGVDINESYIARIAGGMPADVVLDAHPDVHFPAEVRAIYPSADRDKATIPVRVRFLSGDPRIRPDLGAKVSFLKTRPTTEILTVRRLIRLPSAAVQSKNGEKFVWTVRNGKVEPATVTLGETSGSLVEILSGVNEGDQVVSQPARLRKGQRVRVTNPQ
jgi:RND family efflux transporter MFP subunit